MLFSRVSPTEEGGGLRADSTWVQPTCALDELWEALPREDVHTTGRRSVYFIRIRGTAMVKVGYSRDVQRRMATLQTGCPLTLDLEFSVQTERYKEWEAGIHRCLKGTGQHVRGEWFTLPAPLDCLAVLREAGVA